MAKMASLDAEDRNHFTYCMHTGDCDICLEAECEECAQYVWEQGCDSCRSQHGCRCDAMYEAYRDSKWDR